MGWQYVNGWAIVMNKNIIEYQRKIYQEQDAMTLKCKNSYLGKFLEELPHSIANKTE